MRFLYLAPVLPVLALLFVSACNETTGGSMPIDARKLLEGMDGPKIPTLAESQKESAQNAEKKGNFPQAVQIYQQMLERDQNNSDIILALADSLRRSGEYDKAISAYDDLIKKDAKNVAAKEGKGLALISKGDFETPTAIFEEVIKADGTRWKSLNGMGILFVTRNLYHDAQKYFEEALKQSPDNVAVLNNLGLVQALNKQFGDAVQSLSKASANSAVDGLDRKRVDLNLALVYATMGKLDEAEKISRIYLSGAQLSNNLGVYAHLAKDDQMAKSYLNMALTESKTYYGKAWDNLEAISGVNGNTTSNGGDDKKTSSATSAGNNEPANTTANKEKPSAKTAKKLPKKSANKKPIALPASDSKAPASAPKEVDKPAVIDQSLSDVTKADAPKPEGEVVEGEFMQLLGTAKPAEVKLEETKPEAETKIIPTDKPTIADAPKDATTKENVVSRTPTSKAFGTLGTIKVPVTSDK